MKNPMLMFDLETLGTGDNAAILQIGAVLFDPWEGPGGVYTIQGMEFNAHIDPADPEIGELDAPCVVWWMQQSDDARRRVFDRRSDGPEIDLVSLRNALKAFRRWICEHAEISEVRDLQAVWSHTSFDFKLIEQASRRLGLGAMFDRRADRDLRTLSAMGRSLGIEKPLFVGVQHDAVDDAFHQATYATTIIREMGVFKGEGE